MATPRTTFVNPLLTDISVAYKNNSYICDQLFPVVEVDKETGLYFVVDKENLRTPADARRGEFSRANRVMNTLTTASYTLEEKSLETPISERVMKQYQNPFDPKKNATMLVSEKLMLDKELDLQTTILAVASGANTIDASNAWSTISTDIAAQIRTGRDYIQKNTGQKPNTAMISKLSLNALMTNTAFLDSIKYTTVVNEQSLRSAIAAWFDVERVLIGDSVYNNVKEGQTDSISYVWSDNVVLAYVAPSPALETPTAGYTLTLKGFKYVDEWFEDATKTTYVRATDFYDSKIIDTTALYVITNTAT